MQAERCPCTWCDIETVAAKGFETRLSPHKPVIRSVEHCSLRHEINRTLLLVHSKRLDELTLQQRAPLDAAYGLLEPVLHGKGDKAVFVAVKDVSIISTTDLKAHIEKALAAPARYQLETRDAPQGRTVWAMLQPLRACFDAHKLVRLLLTFNRQVHFDTAAMLCARDGRHAVFSSTSRTCTLCRHDPAAESTPIVCGTAGCFAAQSAHGAVHAGRRAALSATAAAAPWPASSCGPSQQAAARPLSRDELGSSDGADSP